MILGGKDRAQFGVDEYVYATIMLLKWSGCVIRRYLDIINLFMYLLQLLSITNNRRWNFQLFVESIIIEDATKGRCCHREWNPTLLYDWRYSNYFKARWTHHLWESTCSQLSRMLVSVDESQVDFSECFVHPIRTGVDRCRKAQRTSFYWSNEGRYYWRMEMWTRAADSSSFLGFLHLTSRLKRIANQLCFSWVCDPLQMKFNIDRMFGNGWKKHGVVLLAFLLICILIVY